MSVAIDETNKEPTIKDFTGEELSLTEKNTPQTEVIYTNSQRIYRKKVLLKHMLKTKNDSYNKLTMNRYYHRVTRMNHS